MADVDEKRSRSPLDRQGLKDQPEAQAARVAGAADLKAMQSLNQNAHNGSAGGDQLESIQIIALDDGGKQKVVAERQKEVKPLPEITTEYLRERAKQPDIWARKFVADLERADKLPAPDRDAQIAKVLKDAEAVYRPKGRAEKLLEPQDQMDTGTLLAQEVKRNQAAEPVQNLHTWTKQLPEGPEKDRYRQLVREQMAELSPEANARAERLAQVNERIKAAGRDEGGVHEVMRAEVVAKYSGRVEHNQPIENTEDGWLAAGQAIASLPIEKQMEVIGAGLLAGVEQYQHYERERAIGQVIGTVQGVGQVLENLAVIAEFCADVLCGNKARAEERGEMFGTALGETLVSGVELFNRAHKYLHEVGNKGEYGKPFKDLSDLGVALNERWSQIPPREQERIKYKLITEMVADGLIGAGGVKALSKTKAFTEVMDAVAIEAKAAGSATGKFLKGVGKQVTTDLKGIGQDVADSGKRVKGALEDLIVDLTAPEMVLEGAGTIKFSRELKRPAEKAITHVLMSQAEDMGSSGGLVGKGVDSAGKALNFSEESAIELGELRLGPDNVWEQAPFPRGDDVHVVLGENLPAGTKTIDRLIFKDGIVESQKSIDLTAPSYEMPQKLESKLTDYVHKLETYKGQPTKRSGPRFGEDEIECKILHIGVKDGSMTAEQRAVFEKVGKQVRDYNENLPMGKAPIKLKVTVVK